MSWYDYIPVAGSVTRLAKGDFGHAAADLLPGIGPAAYDAMEEGAFDHIFDDPLGMDEQRRGLKNAAQQSRDLGNQLKDFQMQGLDKAQGYFQPTQQRIEATYGKPGQFRK